jgi:hypothetical protein
MSTTIERPRARKPRALRKITAAQRRRIEEAVERMIAALDEIDATAEDLEPSLGSSETHPSPYYTTNDASDHQEGWSRGRRDDREEEHDGAEPDVEDEPSLGSVATHEHISQATWSQGDTNELEDQHDGREPDVEDEPSLGSFDAMINQTQSWRQRKSELWFWADVEQDPADGPEGDDERERDQAEESGIGDLDGLAEQTRERSWSNPFE